MNSVKIRCILTSNEEVRIMFKTISYHYKCNKNELKILRFLCHISKNVYNVALYELRQSYIDTKTIPTYFDLNKMVLKILILILLIHIKHYVLID